MIVKCWMSSRHSGDSKKREHSVLPTCWHFMVLVNPVRKRRGGGYFFWKIAENCTRWGRVWDDFLSGKTLKSFDFCKYIYKWLYQLPWGHRVPAKVSPCQPNRTDWLPVRRPTGKDTTKKNQKAINQGTFCKRCEWGENLITRQVVYWPLWGNSGGPPFRRSRVHSAMAGPSRCASMRGTLASVSSVIFPNVRGDLGLQVEGEGGG